jgi:predicted MFS family arabinose efflux permease
MQLILFGIIKKPIISDRNGTSQKNIENIPCFLSGALLVLGQLCGNNLNKRIYKPFQMMLIILFLIFIQIWLFLLFECYPYDITEYER